MSAPAPQMASQIDFRYERKFVVTVMSHAQVERHLRRHPALFRQAYRPRFVNSIYFDTPSLRNYRDSIEGEAHRLKYRIRWYGDLQGPVTAPRLEIKEKFGLVGGKHTFDLAGFDFSSALGRDRLTGALAGVTPPFQLRNALRAVRPVLVNRYLRSYWLSADGRFRITVDSGMAYYRLAGRNCLLSKPIQDTGKVIVELKYPTESDDRATGISQRLPCRLSKSSKYVTGVNFLHHRLFGVETD